MHALKSFGLGLLTVLLAASATGQAVDRTTVVATVDGTFEITVDDLDGRAERLLYRGIVERPERYRTALQEATLDRLKSLDFFRLGYDQDPAFASSLGRLLTEELIVAYYEHRYEDPYLNEDAIRSEHEAMGRVVAYRQIVLRKPENATDTTLGALRSTVEEIRRHLDSGVPVETLVERYSQDEATARNGGRMPPLTWEQGLQSPFNAVVFRLGAGEAVSLETQDAFLVAVAERVGEAPVPPLDRVRDRIVQVLKGRYAGAANEAFYEERQALVDSVSVRWNEDALAQVKAWSQQAGFYEGDYPDIIARHLEAHGDAVLFTDSAGELRMSGLARLLREVLILPASGSLSDEVVRDFLLEAVRADRMADLAVALGLRDELIRPGTESPVLTRAFVDYYDQQRVETQIPDTTEAALQDFYDTHADSLFYQLATVFTQVIVRPDEAEIDALWDRVQRGESFDAVSSRLLIRSYERTRDGEIVTRFNREPPYLGEVAFGLAEGGVGGPVAYVGADGGRLYGIVKATRRLAERQLMFEEVRNQVAEAFVRHHRERLATEVEVELRRRYEVEVDEALLARIAAPPQ